MTPEPVDYRPVPNPPLGPEPPVWKTLGFGLLSCAWAILLLFSPCCLGRVVDAERVWPYAAGAAIGVIREGWSVAALGLIMNVVLAVLTADRVGWRYFFTLW
jgi:hypothetical protein